MAGQIIDSVAKSGKHFILKMYHNKFHYSEVMGILYLVGFALIGLSYMLTPESGERTNLN